jgi:hypothetical protein
MTMLHEITRRALLAGAGTIAASSALAVPYVNAAHPVEAGLAVDPDDLDTRLRSGVGYVRSILRDMGCEEYVLVMREEASGVLMLLDFAPGTGTLKRKLDLA